MLVNMKKSLVVLAVMLSGCTSIESTRVTSSQLVGNGGDAVAVIQVTTIGWTFFFNTVDIVQSDLDETVNKLLVGEAKALGGNKVDLKTATTTPRHGIFRVPAWLFGWPMTQATGVAVR